MPLPADRRVRGFALLIVLWTVALLALFATRVAASGGAETRIAAALRASAAAEAAADGAIQVAAFRLLSPQGWAAGPVPHVLRLGAAVVTVRIASEQWRVPLNGAPAPLFQALLQELGADSATAAALAQRLQDWRAPRDPTQPGPDPSVPYRAAGLRWGPPNAPFRSVDELAMVLGMSPDLLARLRPHVTPFTEGLPAPSTPDAVVARALARLQAGGVQPLAADPQPVLRITARAQVAGARFTRQAVVRLNGADAAPVRILDWREGTD